MGLDIEVCKVEPLGDRNPQDIEDFMILEGNPELDIFKHLAFERENEYYDFVKGFADMGHDIKELVWGQTSYGEDGAVFSFRNKNKEGEYIEIKNPPIIKKKELCIATLEVGYQRKGANNQFYEDGAWNSTCIVDKKTLLEHWDKYFSKKIRNNIMGSFGSGLEFDLEDNEMRDDFKKNIIDKFVEGETFVIYC